MYFDYSFEYPAFVFFMLAILAILRSPNPLPRVWLFILGKDSAPSGGVRWIVLAMSLVCFVFAVGYINFMFMPFTVT